MRWILGVASAAALLGCGSSVCSKLQSDVSTCGGTFDESACSTALSSCSSSDQSLLTTLGNCLAPACSGGKLVDGGGALETSCVAAASISTACANALGTNFPAPPNTSAASEEGNPDCPSPPAYLTGTGAAGSACSSDLDCMPICCTCSTGGKQYLAAECDVGACAPTLACAATETPQLCP